MFIKYNFYYFHIVKFYYILYILSQYAKNNLRSLAQPHCPTAPFRAKKNALRVSRGTFKRRVPFYFLRGPTFAICALMNIFELSTPGVCPCRSNSIFTWGSNIRQYVEPPKWNIPNCSPFLTCWPS